jgi:hypothetical protein
MPETIGRGLRCRAGALLALLAWALLACAGCASDDAPGSDPDAGAPLVPLYPEDFESQYLEMRDCRLSHEHELRFIRVLVSPGAEAPYAALSPDAPYPVGAILVKPEYDEPDCTAPLSYTAMEKLAPGARPEGGDWRWQRVDLDRKVVEDGAPERCVTCHTRHCAPPYGYDLTCAEEL